MSDIYIEISIGELMDRYTILRIKLSKTNRDVKKAFNIKKDLDQLEKELYSLQVIDEILLDKLYQINLKLWNLEDEIRLCEANSRFDFHFISLARSIYLTNDERFKLKNQINEKYNSSIREEKILPEYK